MSTRMKIVILFHQNNNSRNIRSYSIVYSANLWRQQGHEVVFLFGTKTFVAADICFVHLDLSVVPDEYLEFANQYPVVVNGEVKDIRKSSFSQNLLSAKDDYAGKVIVKTDLNYAGWPEKYLTYPYPILVLFRLMNKMPWLFPEPCTSRDYKIYSNLSEVPGKYFDGNKYVVEKFLPEKEGEYYSCHSYLFMGDSYVCNKKSAKMPIIKDRDLGMQVDVEPHPEAVAMKQKMGIGYGKLDYCMNNGKMILIDVNKTFTFSRPPGRIEVAAEIFHRTGALESFFN